MSTPSRVPSPVTVEESSRAGGLFQRAAFLTSEPLKAHVRRLWKGRDLEAVCLNEGLSTARIVVVVVIKDEAARMSHFLDHYRTLGAEHFIVIDNESSDDLGRVVTNAPDVSVFRARGSYRAARFGNDWVNSVLAQHCVGRWVLYVDADEFLVYEPGDWDLSRVCDWLEGADRRSLQAIMIDMYSESPSEDNMIEDGQDPLEVCALYDGDGYARRFDPVSRTMWIKGGVRGRLFFPRRWSGPALNKTPLVRWRKHHAFLKSSHQVWPAHLNGGRESVDAALLHFKFTSIGVARMLDSGQRAQHSREYDAYGAITEVAFPGPSTRRYSAPSDLVRDGLMTPLGHV